MTAEHEPAGLQMVGETGVGREALAPAGARPSAAWQRTLRRWLGGVARFARREPAGAAGLVGLLAFAAMAASANVISPHDPLATGIPLQRFSATHPLGTDQLGRDMLSRIIWGARTAMLIGAIASAVSVLAGLVLGVLSGFVGGVFDLVFQRVVDAVTAFPVLLLALVVVALFGASLPVIVAAIALGSTPTVIRVIRSSTLALKEVTFVLAARSAGASQIRIMWRHIVPNVTSLTLVFGALGFAQAILAEAALGYLGLGVPPPTPDWGSMLSAGAINYMLQDPWVAVFPGVAISLAVLFVNLLGDALRDYLDPSLRGW